MPRRPPETCAHSGCQTRLAVGNGLCGKHRLETSATTKLVLSEERDGATQPDRPTITTAELQRRGWSLQSIAGMYRHIPGVVTVEVDGVTHVVLLEDLPTFDGTNPEVIGGY